MIVYLKTLEIYDKTKLALFFADTAEDLSASAAHPGISYDEIAPGSKCTVANGDKYLLNSTKNWIKIENGSSPSPTPTPSTNPFEVIEVRPSGWIMDQPDQGLMLAQISQEEKDLIINAHNNGKQIILNILFSEDEDENYYNMNLNFHGVSIEGLVMLYSTTVYTVMGSNPRAIEVSMTLMGDSADVNIYLIPDYNPYTNE